jgi:hypothetical protein
LGGKSVTFRKETGPQERPLCSRDFGSNNLVYIINPIPFGFSFLTPTIRDRDPYEKEFPHTHFRSFWRRIFPSQGRRKHCAGQG